MLETREFIKSVVAGEEKKYITLNQNSDFITRLRIKVGSDKHKQFTHTEIISNKADSACVLAAFAAVKSARNKIYLDNVGEDLEEWLSISKKLGLKHNPISHANDNVTGYTGVSVHLVEKNGRKYYGFLAAFTLKETRRKLFNFPQERSEDDAFISACRQVDEWHLKKQKSDKEYLSLKNVVDWDAK